MKCRRCKNLLDERDLEIYVVHQWEGHGVKVDDTKKMLEKHLGITDFNDEYILELTVNHKETGKKGSGMFKQNA